MPQTHSNTLSRLDARKSSSTYSVATSVVTLAAHLHLLLLAFVQAWSAGALIAFVLVFNCIPAALELLTFLFVARVSYFSY